jgi:hypothetical protein
MMTTNSLKSDPNPENVQVTVRCRPPSKTENNNCWNLWEANKIISNDPRLKKQHSFNFGKQKTFCINEEYKLISL